MKSTKMGSCSFTLLALVSLTLLAILNSSQAQNTKQNYLNAHNSARSAVGVDHMKWNDKVEAYAKKYANKRIGDCALTPSGGGGIYGENIARGSGLTGAAAVNKWVGEKPYYIYSSNRCAAGQVCKHYTQVVWKKSVWVGCARVQCKTGWWYIICNYYPKGNLPGQRPY